MGKSAASYIALTRKRQRTAQQATRAALATYALASSPYHQHGLGAFDWGDIAKTFATQIGTGVSNKIGGHAPAPVTIVNPAPPPVPLWQKAAIGAAIGLPLVYLITRR